MQNYNENANAVLTAHGKTFIPQKLSMEPAKAETNTLGYATSIIFPFWFFFFCPLQVILFCPEPDSEPTEAYENISRCLPKASDQAPDEDEHML